MEIKKLDRKMYEGHKFVLRYITSGYYDIAKSNTGFQIEYKRFDKPTEMTFDDCMFNEWLEDPVAYGAFEDGQLLGYVEGTLEKWNNRYRISNICVFQGAFPLAQVLADPHLIASHDPKAHEAVLEVMRTLQVALL